MGFRGRKQQVGRRRRVRARDPKLPPRTVVSDPLGAHVRAALLALDLFERVVRSTCRSDRAAAVVVPAQASGLLVWSMPTTRAFGWRRLCLVRWRCTPGLSGSA